MIEFTAQAEIKAVETVLIEVGSSGSFSLKPDRFIKSTSVYRKFVLFANGSNNGSSQECGTIELLRKKESIVFIKINIGSTFAAENPLATPMDRFFYLFTQRLLQEGMVAVELPPAIRG